MHVNDVPASSHSTESKEKERTCCFPAQNPSFFLSLVCCMLLCSLTLLAARNKYHKWNREEHAEREKALAVMLMKKRRSSCRLENSKAQSTRLACLVCVHIIIIISIVRLVFKINYLLLFIIFFSIRISPCSFVYTHTHTHTNNFSSLLSFFFFYQSHRLI